MITPAAVYNPAGGYSTIESPAFIRCGTAWAPARLSFAGGSQSVHLYIFGGSGHPQFTLQPYKMSMVTPEKIDAVKKQLRSGIPEGEIKNDLRNEGYTEEEIQQLFPPHKADMRSWYLVFGTLFCLAGLYFLITKGRWLFLGSGLVLISLYVKENKSRKQ